MMSDQQAKQLLHRVFSPSDNKQPARRDPLPKKYIPRVGSDEVIEWLLTQTTYNEYTDCLEWNGSTTKDGYPVIVINDHAYRVHRLIAFLAKIEDLTLCLLILRSVEFKDFFVCHTCDNPICINLDHLVIADAEYNTLDAHLKKHLPAS